jgi:hypothetical protein
LTNRLQIVGEKFEEFLDNLAQPTVLSGGKNLRVFWNAVPHEADPDHPEDKDWADSDPDPHAP